MKTKLGALLRAIRNTRNLTIKDVVAKAGISSSLLSQIERNRISPSLDTLLQLLEVYGVSPDKFFKDYETQSQVEIIRKTSGKSINAKDFPMRNCAEKARPGATIPLTLFFWNLPRARSGEMPRTATWAGSWGLWWPARHG